MDGHGIYVCDFVIEILIVVFIVICFYDWFCLLLLFVCLVRHVRGEVHNQNSNQTGP